MFVERMSCLFHENEEASAMAIHSEGFFFPESDSTRGKEYDGQSYLEIPLCKTCISKRVLATSNTKLFELFPDAWRHLGSEISYPQQSLVG